jgi:hypothetical protein
MSITEDRVKNIEGRLTSLESKFNLAVTLALFLGISVAGLGAWVKSEAGKVSQLHQDVTELQPFVKNAKEQLEKTGLEQISLIQTKAEPIVTQLTKQSLDKMSSNGSATGEGSPAKNLYGIKDFGNTEISCPAGQYLAGMTVHWGGTCNGSCDQDGGPVHLLVPICRKLVP